MLVEHGVGGIKGKNWENCNSIINKIKFKKRYTGQIKGSIKTLEIELGDQEIAPSRSRFQNTSNQDAH